MNEFIPKIQILPELDINGNTLAMVRESFEIFSTIYEEKNFVVPENFLFDGASIPRFLWRVFGHPFHAQYLIASCCHDYLYSTGKVSRLMADVIFYDLLKNAGVSSKRSFLMFIAVRLFGHNHYKGKKHGNKSK